MQKDVQAGASQGTDEFQPSGGSEQGDAYPPLAPLTIVSAPRGYGKTIWVDQRAAELNNTALVVRVDGAHTGEPSAFWCSVAQEIAEEGHASETPGNRFAEPETCWGQVQTWACELTAPTVLIVDNFEHVTDAKTDLKLGLLPELNEYLSVLVAGRGFTVLDTPLVTARVDTHLVTERDLSLSSGAAAALFARHAGAVGGPWAQVVGAAQGWPELLGILAESAGRGDAPGPTLCRALERLCPGSDSRRLLRFVDLLGEAKVSVLAEALGWEYRAVEAGLQRLACAGLVSRRMRGQAPTYRAHPIVTLAAQCLIGEEISPTQKLQMVARQAEDMVVWDAPGALHLLLTSGSLRQADELTGDHLLRLVGEPERTFGLLEHLNVSPGEPATALLGLRLLLAQGMPRISPSQVMRWGEELYASLRALPEWDTPGFGVYHQSALSTVLRLLGKLDEAEMWAVKFEQTLAEHQYRGSRENWTHLPIVYLALGLTGLLTGQLDLSKRAILQGLRIGAAEGSAQAQVRAHNLLALHAVLGGEFGVAGEHLSQAKLMEAELDSSDIGLNATSAALASASIELAEGRPHKGLRLLDSIEPLLDRMETWRQFVLLESWLVRFTQGNREAMQRLQERVAERKGPELSELAQSQLAATLANLAIYAGDVVIAELILSRPVRSTVETKLAKARVNLMKGDPHAAHLQATEATSGALSPGQDLAASLLAALALQAAGDQEGALQLVSGADLPANEERLLMVASTLPYRQVRDLAKTIRNLGDPRLLQAVDAIPAPARFMLPQQLTPAEERTAAAIAKTSTVRAASEQLGLSLNTVKAHLKRIYKKLDVKSRDQMIQVAQMRGIIP